MTNYDNQIDILIIATKAKMAGLTQESISEAIGASQSQVSRILSGKSKNQSRLSKEICEYVNSYLSGISPDLVKNNDELIEALASVWDGTSHQSKALAAVIRSLAPLCLSVNQRNALSGKES